MTTPTRITELGKTPRERRGAIIESAMRHCRKHGYNGLTREHIAADLDISKARISQYIAFQTLIGEVIKRGVEEKNVVITAQALSAGSPAARFAVRHDSDFNVAVRSHLKLT